MSYLGEMREVTVGAHNSWKIRDTADPFGSSYGKVVGQIDVPTTRIVTECGVHQSVSCSKCGNQTDKLRWIRREDLERMDYHVYFDFSTDGGAKSSIELNGVVHDE